MIDVPQPVPRRSGQPHQTTAALPSGRTAPQLLPASTPAPQPWRLLPRSRRRSPLAAHPRWRPAAAPAAKLTAPPGCVSATARGPVCVERSLLITRVRLTLLVSGKTEMSRHVSAWRQCFRHPSPCALALTEHFCHYEAVHSLCILVSVPCVLSCCTKKQLQRLQYR